MQTKLLSLNKEERKYVNCHQFDLLSLIIAVNQRFDQSRNKGHPLLNIHDQPAKLCSIVWAQSWSV